MFRKRVLWIIAVVLLASLSFGNRFYGLASTNNNKGIYEGLKLFTRTLSIVQNQYVDIEKVNQEKLIYGAIKGMLESLGDPHTRFMSPDVYKEMKVETEGAFGGVGIVIGIKEHQLTVISPIEDTPAAIVGMKAGDEIIEINGENTKDITLFDAVAKLRGAKGTQVTIMVRREGIKEPISFTITRDIIEIKSVKYDTIQGHIGYIRITNFNQNTASELKKAISKLKENTMDSLILDLRNNPGGLLDSAIAVASEFLSPGMLIVSTKGRTPEMNIDYITSKNGNFVDCPLVVLVNGGSASASEIVSGAIQDPQYKKYLISDQNEYLKLKEKKDVVIEEIGAGKWSIKEKVGAPRGVVLGEKSFGKGSVQTVIPVSEDCGIALTTAKYYTPSGRSIHGKGIIPDIIAKPYELTTQESEMIDKLYESDYIKKFIQSNPAYTEENLTEFVEKLAKQGINLNRAIIQRSIEVEKRRIEGKGELIYDIATDPQLQRAVDVLVASQIINKGK